MDIREKMVGMLCEVQDYGIKHTCEEWSVMVECKDNEIVADHLIANGVTAQGDKDINVPTKWISVKERLPEIAMVHNTRWDKSTDSIRVLCACVQEDGKKMVKEGYCKVYSDGFVHWKIPGTIHSVTHWQYLPQPPKGE